MNVASFIFVGGVLALENSRNAITPGQLTTKFIMIDTARSASKIRDDENHPNIVGSVDGGFVPEAGAYCPENTLP